jgi:hypothetical protein
MMREKSLLMYWTDKGHNATIISPKMEGYVGSLPPSYPWVTKWLWALKRGQDIFEPCEHSVSPQDPLTGLRVLEFLNSTSFPTIRQITTATKIPQSTVFDHLKG